MLERVFASAPGKLVLSGEYAVLAGAPALALAVDRRVVCTLTPQASGDWQILSHGFAQRQTLTKAAAYAAPPATTAGIMRQALAEAVAPDHLQVVVDSRPCYHHGIKLGVGSSAAVVVALATAAARLGGGNIATPALMAIHRQLQGGGSGLDVAAAAAGGLIRFQQTRRMPARLPAGLHLAFVFAGASSRTAELVARFDAWRAGGRPPALSRLVEAAVLVADCTADCTITADAFAAALGEYAAVLRGFDRAAGIGVFGPAHRLGWERAEDCGVVYKPCGAGGGDMGLALATSPERLAAFRQALVGTQLTWMDMEMDPNGVVVSAR